MGYSGLSKQETNTYDTNLKEHLNYYNSIPRIIHSNRSKHHIT
jgi:hypothetical protein